MSSNGSGGNTHRILRCRLSNGGEEGAVAEFGGKHQRKNAGDLSPRRGFRDFVAFPDGFFSLFQFLVHLALVVLERFCQYFDSKVRKCNHSDNVVKGNPHGNLRWNGVEYLSYDN